MAIRRARTTPFAVHQFTDDAVCVELLAQLVRSRCNVLVSGVRIENSPSFHVVFNNSEYITVDGVKISAPASAPNTDAIDPVGSRHVAISNNTISVAPTAGPMSVPAPPRMTISNTSAKRTTWT